MPASRPLVRVFDAKNNKKTAQITMPCVLVAPIRNDVVQYVHTALAKNARQAYSVYKHAGKEHSAASWGTGRAVSRIPRIAGGGTHRSGQGAFGNMCRSGRMFAPTKVWRKWHVGIARAQRRFATSSAIAASALPSLVMARGHRVQKVREFPVVVSNSLERVSKTAAAVKMLQRIGAGNDLERVQNSRKLRAGKGKMRNRRFEQRKGPLVVYAEDHGITRAFRNVPGVDTLSVERLNLLQLAPGGHIGRFIIWTEGAFRRLDAIYGSFKSGSSIKKGFTLPRPVMSNPDVARIINSNAIQNVLKAKKRPVKYTPLKKNPLKNNNALFQLNPYARVTKRAEIVQMVRNVKIKKGIIKKAPKKKLGKSKIGKRKIIRAKGKKFYASVIA